MAKQDTTGPRWDLGDLYQGIDDPKIAADLEGLEKRARKFAEDYREALSGLSVAGLAEALSGYEVLLADTDTIDIFAHLTFSVESERQEVQAFLQQMQSKCLAIRQHVLFFELELLQFEEDRLEGLVAEDSLTPYRHFLEKLIAEKPHRLSEVEERIFHDKDLTGRSAWVRYFEQEQAKQRYVLDGKKKELTQDEVLHLLRDGSRKVRKAAAQSITKQLAPRADRMAYVMNMVMEDKAIDDRYRGFERPESARHLDNEISQEVVDAMVEVVQESYGLVEDYYTFKKKVLGYDRLYDYDRYAPVVANGRKFSFAEAREMVLESFGGFSTAYRDAAAEFFEKSWIDAAMAPGKQGGAYCMYVTPKLHPYVFMNYTGSADSVSTLAHELGHGVHAYLSQGLSYLHFDIPLTTAETASVFGEMLLFQKLKGELTSDEEKLGLVMEKIESIFATIYRQTAMFLFERDVHALRQQGELSVEQLNELWQKRQQEMFGKSIELTEGHAFWWSYIPHIVRSPFYVYAYAFGELLTLALYEQHLKGTTGFVQHYEELLAAGGSKSPRELLEPFNIDLAQADFWREGTELVRALVDEAKELYSKQ